MSECIDKRLGEKLYAWELGILDDAESDEFEIHLIECEYCRARVKKYSSLFSQIGKKGEFREIAAEVVPKDDVLQIGKEKKRHWPKSLPALIVTAAAILILIFMPWDFDLGSEAAEDTNEYELNIFSEEIE